MRSAALPIGVNKQWIALEVVADSAACQALVAHAKANDLGRALTALPVAVRGAVEVLVEDLDVPTFPASPLRELILTASTGVVSEQKAAKRVMSIILNPPGAQGAVAIFLRNESCRKPGGQGKFIVLTLIPWTTFVACLTSTEPLADLAARINHVRPSLPVIGRKNAPIHTQKPGVVDMVWAESQDVAARVGSLYGQPSDVYRVLRKSPGLQKTPRFKIEFYQAVQPGMEFGAYLRQLTLSAERALRLSQDRESVLRTGVEQVVTALLSLAQELCRAHDKNVIHFDIKPSNMMYEPRSGRAALVDLDMSDAYCREKGLKKSPRGTLPYVGPEVLARQPFGCSVDVYSFGMLIALDVLKNTYVLHEYPHCLQVLREWWRWEKSLQEDKRLFENREACSQAYLEAAQARLAQLIDCLKPSLHVADGRSLSQRLALQQLCKLVQAMTRADSGERPTMQVVCAMLQEVLQLLRETNATLLRRLSLLGDDDVERVESLDDVVDRLHGYLAHPHWKTAYAVQGDGTPTGVANLLTCLDDLQPELGRLQDDVRGGFQALLRINWRNMVESCLGGGTWGSFFGMRDQRVQALYQTIKTWTRGTHDLRELVDQIKQLLPEEPLFKVGGIPVHAAPDANNSVGIPTMQ